MQIRSRIIAVLAPAAVVLAAGTGAGSLAVPAAGAATATGRTTLAGSQIEMGSSGQCVAATKAKAGAAVTLSKCSTTSADQRWEVGPDGSTNPPGAWIALASAPTLLLSADSSTASDLAVLSTGTGPDSDWFPQADKTLVNIGLSADPQHQMVLDWGNSQLHVTGRATSGSQVARQQFVMPHTTYASSSLTNRPDSGGGGDSWALDTMTRQASVTKLSDGSYEASIVDNGTFVTVYGNLTPNQGLNPAKTLGDDSVGHLSGHWGFTFTTTAAPSAASMPKTVNGLGTEDSGDWYKLFFPPSTSFGGAGAVSAGPLDWSWSYSLADNCGNTETWLDADNDNSGQEATGPFATDITAPAPSSCP